MFFILLCIRWILTYLVSQNFLGLEILSKITYRWKSGIWCDVMQYYSSMLMLFYTQLPYRMTILWLHNACSSLLGTRERFICWTRVSYLWLKKKGREWGKVASALGWNMDTQILLCVSRCCLSVRSTRRFKSSSLFSNELWTFAQFLW